MEDARKDQKNRAGFTLVELVVVIAILGILAGVAYAGYGGYIKYAKGAGDNDLIAAVNLAFASACEDQGIARTDMIGNDARLERGTGQSIKSVINIKVKGQAIADQEGFKAAFDRYFAGNADKELKQHKVSDISFANGTDLFILDGVKFRNDAFFESSLGKDKDTVESVLQDVGDIADTIADMFNPQYGKFKDVKNFNDFMNELNSNGSGLALGLQALGLGGLSHPNTEIFQEFVQEFGLKPEDSMQKVANSLMLYAAGKVNDAVGTQEGLSKAVEDYKAGKQDNTLVKFFLQVGEMESYYQSGYASDQFKAEYKQALKDMKSRNLFDIFSDDSLINKFKNDVSDTYGGYTQYQESGQVDKDLAGFLAGLSAIDENADVVKSQIDSTDAFNSLLDIFKSAFN